MMLFPESGAATSSSDHIDIQIPVAQIFCQSFILISTTAHGVDLSIPIPWPPLHPSGRAHGFDGGKTVSRLPPFNSQYRHLVVPTRGGFQLQSLWFIETKVHNINQQHSLIVCTHSHAAFLKSPRDPDSMTGFKNSNTNHNFPNAGGW
jgi:hypothetical protein